MNKIFSKNAFLWLLVLMVLLGKLIPYRESYNAYFNLGTFIDWGIVIIFLLYGLKLNIREVVNDIKNWKLHLLVELATFAKGNVPSAIFNASISGLIGIFATPMLMQPFMDNSSSSSVDQASIIQQLLLKVLLPIVLGLLLNPLCRKFITRYGKLIGKFDRLIILLIVYESFSTAFVNQVFSSVPAVTFVIIAGASVGLFFIVYHVLGWAAKRLGFNREDTITTTFCGSKKSLVHGSLFMMVLGIPDDNKVMFLLPIMLYHSFQLFYVSWLANKLSTEKQ